MGTWAITHRSPITIPLTEEGDTTVLSPLADLNTAYRLFAIQFVNKGGKVVVEMKEGGFVRWRGQIDKNDVVTVIFGVVGWTFDNGFGLTIGIDKKPKLDCNILAHGTVLTTI